MASPQYQSLSEVPTYLATRSELRSWGLRPGSPPVATVTVMAKVSGAARQEKLYHVAGARAIEPAQTLAQGATAGKKFA